MKGIIIICTTCLLVSKYFVCRYTFDRCNLFERLDVEVLLVAKDKVAPRLLCHVVVLKLNYILKCERRQSCVYLTANIVVDATLLGRLVRVDNASLGDALRCYALHSGLLGKLECGWCLRQSVKNIVEHVYAVHHLVVL